MPDGFLGRRWASRCAQPWQAQPIAWNRERSAAWSIDPQRVLVDVENGFHLAAVVRLHPRKRMIWRMIFAS
jgi:hypothetical protein